MAQNNPALFDALMAGGCGGTLERWITASSSNDYDSLVDAVEAFATAVDAAIPTIGGDGPSISQINLIQSIVQGIVSGRNLTSLNSDTFADIAASIAAVFTECEARLNNVPAVGGSFAPIQNTRFWQPGFVGTANGSIAAPYPTLIPFKAELVASSGGEGWLLNIPGLQNLDVGAFTVPDLIEGALVVSGIFPDMSIITTPWVIEQQSGAGSFMAFRDLWLTSLVATWTGGLQLNFDNCWIDGITADSDVGLQGTAVFRDTGAANIKFPATGNFDIKMYGGGLSGECSWRGGEIYNASIGGGSTYVLGLAVTRFVGCTFGTGITIDNTNTPTLEMDTFSHSTFISSGVTFGGTVIVLD